jgi:hypothetical protein
MNNGANTMKLGALSVLRIVIGWHFLTEGLIRLAIGNRSAHDYLILTGR